MGAMRANPSRRINVSARGATVALAALLASRAAGADPLRLRGDALVQTRAPAPVGLVMLHGEDKLRPGVDADAVAWMGVSDQPEPTGDVLTLSVRARDAATGSELRVGRMLVATGAIRPVHLDGARGAVRVFGGTTAEAFGGVPVVRRFGYRDFEWAAGGRLAQSIGDRVTLGASYLHRRVRTARADEEVGADLALTPAPWLTAAGRYAYDVVGKGTTDALASVSAQGRDERLELFVTHRSPGRMLPSTSLFSVLGDFAATSVGTTGRLRAFPRLELLATGSAQTQGDAVGGQGLGRVTLALDDEWEGSIGLEVRRVHFDAARWVGVRAVGVVPVTRRVRLSTELELVRPDEGGARGELWPWALVAARYALTDRWDVAGGLEASAGPSDRAALYGIARASYAFDGGGRR